MKGRTVALGQIAGRGAAALIVDGQLEDLLLDPPEDAATAAGAIFRAVADRPVKGLGGVFVKLPQGRGFLRQAKGVAAGKPLLVQVTGPAEPGKALPVTTRLLFRSRYCILTPGAPGLNIARGIRDEDARAHLAALAQEGMEGADEELGLILRSACASAEAEEIAADLAETRALAEAVMADLDGPPELLLDAPDAALSAWRDWAEPAPDEVDDSPTAFADHGVEEMVDALLSPAVPLPGGAKMFIEPTRALIAVDINTGADTSPAASLKANIAAARALPRQLRLRGLGGQIVIDFAPMPKRDRATLDQVLKAAFRHDGAETALAGWTPLGNYEMQRKRDRLPLAASLGEGGAA
ncbi:ribonuclease E/G [Solirhodobacter olei]|uniref:ribonuclease E/G n=1 Tax=Solirhodobacter olei TaxID=2493082 RepID=UPI000FD9AD0F|nr:ribonuclease E/G [Solirhodobacter olei]